MKKLLTFIFFISLTLFACSKPRMPDEVRWIQISSHDQSLNGTDATYTYIDMDSKTMLQNNKIFSINIVSNFQSGYIVNRERVFSVKMQAFIDCNNQVMTVPGLTYSYSATFGQGNLISEDKYEHNFAPMDTTSELRMIYENVCN